MNEKVKKLQAGEVIITSEPGNSMSPRIKHRQPHKLAPVTSLDEVSVGDVVYCKVRGNFLTHLVRAKDEHRGVLVSNLRGRVNGWTKCVYGKVIEVLN